MNLPHRIGDRYRCFVVEREDRKDGTPRQHAHNRCAGKNPGHKIELEYVQHMTTREYR